MLAVFVASHKNYNLLDKHIESTNLKKISGDMFSLEEFVKRNMQLYRQCTELILERTVFKENDEAFIAWINQFNVIYTARITVIYENALQSNEAFIKELIKNKVYNLVTAESVEELDEQLEAALSKGMTLKYWTKQFPELESTDEIVIAKQQLDFCSANAVKIFVGGSQARTGTTTTALGLARLLA